MDDRTCARRLRTTQRKVLWAAVAALLWLAAATAALAAEPPPRHVVQPGDTLSALAEQYGSTVPALVTANALRDPDRIEVGQTLVMPPAHAPLLRIEVAPGDTLHALAQRAGISVDALRQINDMAPDDRLWVGQDLLVPPSPALPSPALPPGPLLAIETLPTPARQGATVLIKLIASEPLSVTVRWGEQTIPVQPAAVESTTPVAAAVTYWGLVGIPVLTAPGRQALDIRWQSANAADALRWPLLIVDGDYPTFDIVLPPGKGDLLDPQLVRAEAEKVAAIWYGPETARAWKGRFRRPIDDQFVTSAPFGQKRSYNSGPVNSFHAGQDFSAPEGAWVRAPAPGVVVLAEPLTVRGNAVIIDHGLGVYTGYWHLSQVDVVVGQALRPGDLLGLVGTTGLSTGNHLHWELRLRGVAVDPMQWLVQAFP